MVPLLAHDLRAYLNTVVLNVEIIQRVLDRRTPEGPTAETSEKIRRSASLIGSEIAALDRMLQAVLGQARLSEAEDRFDLRGLFEELAIVFECYGRHRRIRVSADPTDQPLPIAGDRDAVKHALVSCLMSAVDEMRDGGELTLRLRADRARATLSARSNAPPDGGGDSGAAARPSRLERDASAARDLAVDVFTRHGGRIQETRDPHGHLSFDIELPLTSPHA